MRKLIWLFLLVLAVTSSLYAAPRRRGVRHPGAEAVKTQYRVDAHRSGTSLETGPRWLDTELWNRPLPGPVRGLVFDRNVVYAGGFGGVYAVNPANGADLWVFSQPNVQFSPVAIVDDEVYVSGGNTFYVLDRATGALLWSINTLAAIDKTSPLIVDDVAFVGDVNGVVYAINLVGRSYVWSRNIGSPVRTHLASSKEVLVVVTDGALRGVNMGSGIERWSKAGNWSAPAADDKHVYAGLDGGAFYKLDVNSGHTEWTFTDPNSGSQKWSTPALKDDTVVVAGIVTNGNQWFYKIDVTTGMWRLFIEQVSTPLISDPIIGSDSRIYFGKGNDPQAPFAPNEMYVFNMQFGFEASRYLYGHVLGAPAIGNGVVFVHDTTNTLSAFTN